jgi:hypothetical protein
MNDIARAIAKEKMYLEYRMKDEEPFHLADAIMECGFDSINEYLKAKVAYEISNLSFDVIETTPDCAITDVMNAINEKKTTVLFADSENTIVWNGNNSQFNKSYCDECDIPVYAVQTGGGTIVSTKGDLNIGICVPKRLLVDARFMLDGLVDILRKYTDKTVKVDGNDVLVDGYKVLGSSCYNLNDMFAFITPVSLTEKSELIKTICRKHSEKQPSHIDFMDGRTLKREVLRWLQIQSI